MDEARCLNPLKIITSEELYLIDAPSSLSFVCDECEVELKPCSYVKNINLRKPYFRTKPGESHLVGCSAEGDCNIKAKGATKRLTGSEGFPLDYPNRFKLRKDDLIDDATAEIGLVRPAKGTRKPNGNIGFENKNKSTYETTSFRSIVKQYFDFPYDRDRPLAFEGIEGNTYDEVFSKIKSTTGKQQFLIQGKERKVYHGILSWSSHETVDGGIRIPLSAGRWVEQDGKRTNERPFYVEIIFDSWPKQTLTKFVNTYKETLDLVRGTNTKAVIAFVGHQDVDGDYFRFYAENRLLIAIKIFSNERG